MSPRWPKETKSTETEVERLTRELNELKSKQSKPMAETTSGGPERAAIPPASFTQPGDNTQTQTTNGTQPQGKLEKIGALWKRKSKNGKHYLSGICRDERIMIFPVSEEYRNSDKSPNYTILVSHKEEKDEDIPF